MKGFGREHDGSRGQRCFLDEEMYTCLKANRGRHQRRHIRISFTKARMVVARAQIWRGALEISKHVKVDEDMLKC